MEGFRLDFGTYVLTWNISRRALADIRSHYVTHSPWGALVYSQRPDRESFLHFGVRFREIWRVPMRDVGFDWPSRNELDSNLGLLPPKADQRTSRASYRIPESTSSNVHSTFPKRDSSLTVTGINNTCRLPDSIMSVLMENHISSNVHLWRHTTS